MFPQPQLKKQSHEWLVKEIHRAEVEIKANPLSGVAKYYERYREELKEALMKKGATKS
jgi:hypothetical protein